MICIQNLEKEQTREILLADFFLASLPHRGVRWLQMLCSEDRQADASVCACLGSVDQVLNTKMELETLEDKTWGMQWLDEYRRKEEYTGARDIAGDPVPGVISHPTDIHIADPLGNTDVCG